MTIQNRQNLFGYALAAIPALFLPVAYLLMACWVFAHVFPNLLSGTAVSDPNEVLLFILKTAYYATLFQLPFYLLWAALSRKLTYRVKILWLIVLVIMNMFAIPWFLFCMYRGNAQTAITKNIRQESIRRFFDKVEVN